MSLVTPALIRRLSDYMTAPTATPAPTLPTTHGAQDNPKGQPPVAFGEIHDRSGSMDIAAYLAAEERAIADRHEKERLGRIAFDMTADDDIEPTAGRSRLARR